MICYVSISKSDLKEIILILYFSANTQYFKLKYRIRNSCRLNKYLKFQIESIT